MHAWPIFVRWEPFFIYDWLIWKKKKWNIFLPYELICFQNLSVLWMPVKINESVWNNRQYEMVQTTFADYKLSKMETLYCEGISLCLKFGSWLLLRVFIVCIINCVGMTFSGWASYTHMEDILGMKELCVILKMDFIILTFSCFSHSHSDCSDMCRHEGIVCNIEEGFYYVNIFLFFSFTFRLLWNVQTFVILADNGRSQRDGQLW